MSEWIKVSDRLPELGVEVLVEVNGHRNPSWRNNYNVVAYRAYGEVWVEERHRGESLIVTHWMPLPEPPKD